MIQNEMKVYDIEGFDLETMNEVWLEWISQFKKNYIDKDFEGDGKDGISKVEVEKDKITFHFITEWKQVVQLVPNEVIVKGKVNKEDEEEDSEELKKEKEYNKKHGVEITETFPFPILEDEEDTKGE